uniref:Uncharacterized protein n=1 Tax=Anguilla anguilla TaxID=7936 RepID=A0A0E9Q4Q4_ANGAN
MFMRERKGKKVSFGLTLSRLKSNANQATLR